jgi:small-conductance mechanosensitive channel
MHFDISRAWTTVQELLDGLVRSLPNFVLALVVLALFHLLGRSIRSAVQRLTRERRRAQNVGLVLGRLTQGVIFLVGLFVGLSIVVPSLRAADLIQLLGISGVAIGFAFREVLQNFLAGILILWSQPFRIGDQIVFGPYEGTVEDIQTRATIIRTYDGRRVVAPNSKLFTESVTVNTAYDQLRQEHDMDLGPDLDVEAMKGRILEAVRTAPDVLAQPPPDSVLVKVSAGGATLRIRWWVRAVRHPEAQAAQDRVLAAIRAQLTAPKQTAAADSTYRGGAENSHLGDRRQDRYSGERPGTGDPGRGRAVPDNGADKVRSGRE